MGQLSRFLANEQGASKAVQVSLERLTPALSPEAANRLLAGLAAAARTYGARALTTPTFTGTKSAYNSAVSVVGTVTRPFTETSTSGVWGGTPGGVLGGVVGGLPVAPPPPRPAGAPIKLGENVTPPERVKHVPPVYPPIAQSARVSGEVGIEITVGADGKVKAARVIKSIPLLDQAAIEAVQQWEFTPARPNGVAVPVIIIVNVDFTLK